MALEIRPGASTAEILRQHQSSILTLEGLKDQPSRELQLLKEVVDNIFEALPTADGEILLSGAIAPGEMFTGIKVSFTKKLNQ